MTEERNIRTRTARPCPAWAIWLILAVSAGLILMPLWIALLGAA